MNGADQLCDALLAHGVDMCFANPGTSEMHFVAALDRRPEMRCVLGLFEGVVTGAADGFARMADRPAATLLHLGPGFANGLANIHNARRARSPMINIVGNHATYHQDYDAPLTSDVEGLARPMSDWVGNCETAMVVATRVAEAWSAAMAGPGIATLLLPADSAWNDADPAPVPRAAVPVPSAFDAAGLEATVAALEAGLRVAFLLDGPALREAQLDLAGRIAVQTGARLLRSSSPGRVEAGAGRVRPEVIPYPIELAIKSLAEVDVLVLVNAAAPVAFFAYPGLPSVPTRPDTRIVTLAAPGADSAGALAALVARCGAQTAEPSRAALALPEAPPPGPLTGEALTALVARAMPAQAIIVNEGLTQARAFPAQSAGSPPHDLLSLTGGAIGMGLPLAAGAAIACPGRKVICLQADGSGMYTEQALWTHAREELDILTIILNNRAYNTLHGEMRRVGVNRIGRNAQRMMDLDRPALDWVQIARGHGVEAQAVSTVEECAALLARVMDRKGPFLIDARI